MTTAEAVKERPILFRGAMVRAILEDTKSQTRRIAKLSNGKLIVGRSRGAVECVELLEGEPMYRPAGPAPLVPFPRERLEAACPYGKPGDRLWVRETWASNTMRKGEVYYAADRADIGLKWTPSLHMPRWASRLTLEVTGVRVEQLHAISQEDALAEGVLTWRHGWTDKEAAEAFLFAGSHIVDVEELGLGRALFALMWSAAGGAWDPEMRRWKANPWVWVVDFRRVKP